MNEATLQDVTVLGAAEAASIEGGSYVHVATFLIGCFGAGFTWGYEVLGPAIFG